MVFVKNCANLQFWAIFWKKTLFCRKRASGQKWPPKIPARDPQIPAREGLIPARQAKFPHVTFCRGGPKGPQFAEIQETAISGKISQNPEIWPICPLNSEKSPESAQNLRNVTILPVFAEFAQKDSKSVEIEHIQLQPIAQASSHQIISWQQHNKSLQMFCSVHVQSAYERVNVQGS